MRERTDRGAGIAVASHRRDIDGLRSFAIVPVLLFHAGIPGIGGGFVGVDIFFVISGYLIARLIEGELRAGRFTLLRFYERRARRILPALLVMMLAVLAAGALLLLPNRYDDVGESVVSTLGFFSNLRFYLDTGYFAAEAASKPLLHTWSLAVEEQYYLLFPLLLMVSRGRLRLWLLLAATGASLAVSAWLTPRDPAAAFFLPHSRFWELLLGALAGLYLQPPAWRGAAPAMAWLGLGCLLLAVFGFDAATPFPGIAALLPCAGTLLLLVAGSAAGERPLVTRLLETPPLVAIGLVSYSLYLWHWPLLVLLREWLGRDLAPTEAVLALAACALVSLLSWRFVEQPFRRPAAGRTRVYRLGGLALLFAAVLAAALWVNLDKGLPWRLPEVARAYLAAEAERPRFKTRCLNKGGDDNRAACRLGATDAATRLLLIGDSHAAVLAEPLDALAADAGLGGLAVLVSGCPPAPGVVRLAMPADHDCREFGARIERQIANPALRVVVIHARWPMYVDGARAPGEAGDPVQLQGGDNAAAVRMALERLLGELQRRGLLVFLVAGVPEVGWDVPNVLARAALTGETPPLALPRAAVDARQASSWALLQELAGRYGAVLIDPRDALCDVERCALAEQGQSLYFDDDHLSLAGSARLIPLFQPYLDILSRAAVP